MALVEFDPDVDIQAANALLIDAAPEMLKALKFIQPWVTELKGDHSFRGNARAKPICI